MNLEFLPQGEITMQEVVVTVTMFLSGVGAIYAWAVRMAQAAKDTQIKALQDTIAYLRDELKKCRDNNAGN